MSLLGHALLVVLCGSAGCGPARFISQVNDKAAGAVAAAKEANADVLAPYEFTAATEYLHKAREEGAYAEYQVAIEYGRRAEDLAVKAHALAVERRNAGVLAPLPTAGPRGDTSPSDQAGGVAAPNAEPRGPGKDSP